MNLRDLEYVQAVATHKNFSRAASVCNVSQPALSSQIKKLELELGVEIFSRQRGEVILTDYGMRVIEEINTVINSANTIKQAARQYGKDEGFSFALGMTPTLAPYLLQYFRELLTRLDPSANIKLVEELPTSLAEKVRCRDIDVALLARKTYDSFVQKTRSAELLFNSLWSEPLFLAVRQGSALAKRKTIKAKDVPADKFIRFPISFGYEFEKDLPNTENIKLASGFDVTGARFETACRHVSLSDDCTLVNSVAAEYFKSCGWGLSFLQFEDPNNGRDLGLVSRAGYNREPFLKSLALAVTKNTPKGTFSPTAA